MARLVFRIGNVPKVIDLVDSPIGIGRRPENQIVLDDGFASGRHCRVVPSAGGWWLEDLKSSNGTLLNGEKITQSRLQNGDVITIGRIQIGYFEDPPAKVKMSDTARLPAYGGPSSAEDADTGRTEPPSATPPAPAPPPPAAKPATPSRPAAAAPKPAPAAAAKPAGTEAPSIAEFSDADLTNLGPTTVQPKSKLPTTTNPLEGARFLIGEKEDRDPMTRTAQFSTAGIIPPGASAQDLASLDALMGSIRSHREREIKEKEDAATQLQEEWQKTMTYCEQLKVKLGKDPRIKFFGVNRRANDVTIRYQRTPSSQIQFMMLSIQHPEDKTSVVQGIWLRRSGQSDRSFRTAEDVAQEMIRDFAFILA